VTTWVVGDRGVAAIAEEAPTADFEVFFRAEFGRLAGYVARMVGEEQSAADLAQEALVRTQARWVRVRQPRPYAYLVATNLARRHMRHELNARAANALLSVGTASSDLGAELDVRDAVNRLPARLSQVVALHYWADLPISEVAKIIQKPEGTVKRRLHEARQLLAQTLKDLP
jgi:RNA polymerase sigma-70 factor (ECF subfamily)